MQKILFSIIILIGCTFSTSAQFVEQGEIVFEVKTNLKKSMGNSAWAEMMKDKLPNFKTLFFKYKFDKEKSQFTFDHWENKESIPEFFRMGDEKTTWNCDFVNNKINKRFDIFGSEFNINDSIPNIQWKLTNENRIIAGYNCRKAIGKVMDSVYVFAFYTDEIIPSGGPCSIGGLPGMILGLTVPRIYTSWIAMSVTSSNTSPVFTNNPSNAKKEFTFQSAKTTVLEKTKDWGDNNDPESRKWIDQMVWGILL